MCHFCTCVCQCICVCVPVHASDIFFQKARNYEMGKFLSGFTFSLLVCREKTNQTKCTKS